MFGWGALAPPPEELLKKERPAIPRPTQLQFPSHIPDLPCHPLSRKRARALRSSIVQLRHPNDVSTTQLEHFNVSVSQDIPISDLVPSDFLPERPYLYDDDLTNMLTELSTDNDDAFRELLRLPPNPGRKKPRLAYSRGFFQNLDDMARYWDDSMDQYYHVPDDRMKAEDAPTEMQTNTNEATETQDVEMTDLTDTSTPIPTATVHTANENPKASQADRSLSNDPTKEVYRGLRIGSGSQMSPGTRVAALRNLTKMATHKFQCRDHDLSSRERLCINKVKIPGGSGSGPLGQGIGAPLRPSFVIARLPRETKLARERKVEGPVLAGWARGETKFTSARDGMAGDTGVGGRGRTEGESTETWDLFREIGCMLVLACMRDREGMTEEEARRKVMGEDKERWWESRSRWGGGPTKWGNLSSELFEDEDPSWSPEERALQEAKREKMAEENKKSASQQKKPMDLNIDDLLASGGLSQPGSSAFDSGGSEYGGGVRTAKLPDLSRPSKKSKTSPTEPTAPPIEVESRSVGKEKGKSKSKDKEDAGEYRDGRRLVSLPAIKKKWYQDWVQMRPGANTWDDKIIWRKIGQPRHDDGSGSSTAGADDGTWDEVYMLSSVNHHVCMMKMRVHQAYLRWLEDGTTHSSTNAQHNPEDQLNQNKTYTPESKMPPTTTTKRPNPDDPAILYVQRSRWFDMLSVDDRVELLTGLWRVLSWLNRDEVPKEAWDALRTSTTGDPS